jgi:glycosyltransferase involved in cell wall biosynthesis
MKLFVFLRYYLPGYKSGGPIRTIANMVDWLGDQFQFWILTQDRDATDTEPYPNVQINSWNQAGKAQVYYASPNSLSWRNIRHLLLEVNPDIVYLNSFFLPLSIQYLIMRRLGVVPHMPAILAPRGEFAPGFLQLKRFTRRAYLTLASRSLLYDNLVWQASSFREAEEIQSQWPKRLKIRVAPNMPPLLDYENNKGSLNALQKYEGTVRFVFLSRIAPVKNLLKILEHLQDVSGHVEFNIYGPIRDESYWHKCQGAIANLPPNIHVNYGGALPHEEVRSILQSNHFFLLPTLGENFGHAIYEALAAGRPAIISDQTIWRDLAEHGAGWDIPLSDDELWVKVLQQAVKMEQAEYDRMVAQSLQYVQKWLSNSDLLQTNMKLFLSAGAKSFD